MKLLFALIFISSINLTYAQDTAKKQTPILFAEFVLGYGGSFGEYSGFLYGGSANFQFKKNLFTFRYTQNPQFKFNAAVAGMLVIPYIESKFKNTEIALLYGRRFIKNGRSLSFSAGIGTNDFETKFLSENNHSVKNVSRHIGFSYELNIKWFKSRKKRYRIYMLVPVGKPTAFGRSFGFKLLGNISKHSYMGFAITYGFGWHRGYIEKID
ncbi:MAG TPA: hypothetical protein VFM82_01060 [Flavobacteriaceae bacterium]|nr:hypothetical protein [Flavobacteriaceae bacterium]